MSRDPSNSDWLERKLEAARKKVNQLEIDACRIRTELARLEAANATGSMDEGDGDPHEQEHRPIAVSKASEERLGWKPVAESMPEGMEILVGTPFPAEAAEEEAYEHPLQESSVSAAEPIDAGESWVAGLVSRSRGMYRRVTSPIIASVAGHAAILIAAVSITVATFERNDPQLGATTLVFDDKPSTKAETLDLQPFADLGETGSPGAGVELPQLDAVGPVDHDLIPIDFDSMMIASTSLGKAGLSEKHETDTGKIPIGVGGAGKDGDGAGAGMAGGGEGGTGKGQRGGGRKESTLFFGTEARGNRFVFVVDNSSSMKGGRLEMAVAELIRTVDGLSAKQSFYVIFVSDKPYPMFYPQQEPGLLPATPANKKRLAEWAPKAILASGHNREMIKAMDLAASMQPQAVYLLWDGDLRYSETVRLDVLTHLTQPNSWNFIIHTLGMGISSPNAEQNLRMIAHAHNGAFRRIDVPGARGR